VETAYCTCNKYLQGHAKVRTSGNEMEAGPRHIANARLTYAPTPKSAFSVEWEHVGWYFTDPDNLRRYDGYDVMNLEVAARS
jgi:hypothetical protein